MDEVVTGFAHISLLSPGLHAALSLSSSFDLAYTFIAIFVEDGMVNVWNDVG